MLIFTNLDTTQGSAHFSAPHHCHLNLSSHPLHCTCFWIRHHLSISCPHCASSAPQILLLSLLLGMWDGCENCSVTLPHSQIRQCKGVNTPVGNPGATEDRSWTIQRCIPIWPLRGAQSIEYMSIFHITGLTLPSGLTLPIPPLLFLRSLPKTRYLHTTPCLDSALWRNPGYNGLLTFSMYPVEPSITCPTAAKEYLLKY